LKLKLNIENVLKLQTCFGAVPKKHGAKARGTVPKRHRVKARAVFSGRQFKGE